MNNPSLDELNERVRNAAAWVDRIREVVGKVVVGQSHLIDRLLVGLLANGHVLLEGVPGLAKTLAVRTLSAALHASFSRVQFTPDLLPADIIGTLIYNPGDGKYSVTRGPVFANIVLADEINRAPAKVQSALLEAMQERQVTLGNETHPLPTPFLVLATENPIDQEGTYPLPEAQVDRFMLKVIVGYPSFEEERRILDTMAFTQPKLEVERVVSLDEILATRAVVDSIHVDEKVRDYIVHVVFATRNPENYQLADLRPLIQFGASPRATIALTLAGKAWALLQGRSFVTPGDIKAIGTDVLRHRIIQTYEAEAQGITSDALVKRIFDTDSGPLIFRTMSTASDILSAVRRVEVKTIGAVNDMMVGAYHSQFKGRGMDFEELREYVPGDDVRTIDWKVTARMRKPFVKLHREERELNVVILLDISASDDFGSTGMSKREFATEVAATLAYSALRNGDKVGLLLFSEEVELFLRPKKGKRHLLRMIREMLAFPAKKRGTNIQNGLTFLNHVLHRRTIVFLLSDFLHSLGTDQTGERGLFQEIGRTSARHDLVCVHILDQREQNLPSAGLLSLEDVETGEIIEVDTKRSSVREAYASAVALHQQQLDQILLRSGVDFVRLTPGDRYATILQRFFEQRRR